MSLHTASKYLAAKGRRGDTELVHMTKDEVRGLQQLALAHGGSLTINPETGLVEAGWLKTILPMVAGAALTVATGGTALAAYAPLMSAALAGGGMYAATGSLKDGLMAGLGAFGGANLAGGIMEAGAAGAIEGGSAAAVEGGGATAAQSAAAQTSAMDAMTKAGMSFEQQAAALGTEGVAGSAAQSAAQTSAMDAMTRAGMGFEQQAAALQTAPGAAQIGSGAGGFGTGQAPTFMQNLEQAGRGLPDIGKVVMNAPGKTALPLAVAGFAGSQDSGVQGFPPNQDSGSSSGLASLSPNFQGTQPTPPSPAYQAQYQDYRKRQAGGLPAYQGFAEGGVVALAGGGMDPMNPIQNPIYPQSQQAHTNFATSTQYPNSIQSAMASDYDTRTNPMTGQELPMGLAAGGKATTLSRSPGMPDGGVYRDTDPDTATKDAYNAALIRLQKINKAAGTKGLTMPKAAMSQLGGSFDSVEEKASGGVARYEDGGAAAGGASGVPAGMGGDMAAAMLSAAGLPTPSGMPSGGLGAFSANNPQMMQAFAALNPFQHATQPAPVAYSNPYSAPLTPAPTVNYQFAKPIATAQSIAKAEAERKAAEEEAARQAAQNSESSPSSWSYASGGIAHYNLGGYSDGGRMLKGPGDGMSDDIPASIGGKQPARLADGEFVVPADVVSHLGNGSTDAGAKKLYGMMDKVRKARTGTKKQGKQIKADKYLPK